MIPSTHNHMLRLPALLPRVVAVLTLCVSLSPLAYGENYGIRTDPNIQTRIDQFVPNPFHEPVRPAPRQTPANSKGKKKAKSKAGGRQPSGDNWRW